LLLIFLATLFMAALFVRNLQPQKYEPAHSAQRIVMWYASKPHIGLWVLLIALPLAVLIIGCGMLLESWNADAGLRQAALQTVAVVRTYLATLIVAGATLTAGGILAIVFVHMLTD
jgi:sterol desaturase/sphingolipid hydroxylase (fatty acid hydroxylase superfamily)